MAAPRNLRGRSASLGSEPQVWSTIFPFQASLPFPCWANLRATSATAESAVASSRTEACSNAGSASLLGIPAPINRTARRAAASLRAAMKAMGTRDCARRRPIACPIRPAPIIATLRGGLCFRILGFGPILPQRRCDAEKVAGIRCLVLEFYQHPEPNAHFSPHREWGCRKGGAEAPPFQSRGEKYRLTSHLLRASAVKSLRSANVIFTESRSILHSTQALYHSQKRR